nr:DUF3152 domain-containing protein [Nucisporomicrobium flavum]
MRLIRIAVAVLTLAGVAACGDPPRAAESPAERRPVAAPVRAKPAPVIAYPARGHGRWRTAPAAARTAGRGGSLLRYRVLVERDITGLSPASFAGAVAATLADPRGWTAGGTLRLRRVGPGQAYDFTVYLATPRTRDRLCRSAVDAYTSCRNGDKVVLNVARWVKGVPGYGAPLSVYRQYMVNHEVGHRLGNGHERCPGRGEPAPVMQQQTLGLHGCTPNPWPYVDGGRYQGRAGAYADPMPAPDRGR